MSTTIIWKMDLGLGVTDRRQDRRHVVILPIVQGQGACLWGMSRQEEEFRATRRLKYMFDKWTCLKSVRDGCLPYR
eukprot:10414126-Karenia_brevis.AAC.1